MSRIPLPTVLLVLLVLLALLAGCREPAPHEPPPPTLANDVVTDAPLVVPGDRWEAQNQGRWTFKNRASLLVWVPRVGTEPLVLHLRPGQLSAMNHFRVAWDGEVLVRRTFGEEEGAQLEIPAERLTEGLHELTLDRDYELDTIAVRREHRNVFTELRYRYGEHHGHLVKKEHERYAQLAEFLQHGVMQIGSGESSAAGGLRAGILVVGSHSHVLEVPRAAPATLHLEPANLSAAPATFRVADEELELAPGESDAVEVELAAGENRVELVTEGADDGLFLWGAPFLEQDGSDALPPIVLVTLDTTRRDALSPYNGRTDLTPNLEELASRATVFEDALSTAPWTLPSHASIFTGLYPSRHGAGVSEVRLPLDIPTLAEELRRHGYMTGGFSSGDLSSSRFGVARGFLTYRDPERFESPGAEVAAAVDAFLDAYGERPFFLFVNYFDPHAMHRAPPEYEERFGVPELAKKVPEDPILDELLADRMAGWRGLVDGRAELTPEVVAYLRAGYDAEIAYTDALLGRLFDRLRKLGVFDRALVIVTADHGELLGEGGYLSHAARLDPELVEIPLLVKEPGQREGRRDSTLVSLVDLFPTVLHAVGLEPPSSDGRPLPLPGLGGVEREPRQYVLFEEHAFMIHPLPERMKISPHLLGLQRPRYRQQIWQEGQLCARAEGGTKEGAGTAWVDEECTGDLEKILAALRAELGREEGASTADEPVPDELRESLEALGYM